VKTQATRTALSSATVAMFAASVASAQISFDPAVNYECGASPRDVAVADFDNDGWPDVVVTLASPARLGVLRNQGDGTFGAPEFLDLTGASAPEAAVAVDFDLDGLFDLALLSSGTDEVWVLHNLGDAHFAPIARVPVGDDPCDVSAGDIDGDGDFDLATSNRLGGSVTVVRNDGAGQFAVSQTLAVGAGPREIQFGHFATKLGGPGLHDLAVSCHDSHELCVLRNDGSGGFVPLVSLTVPGSGHPEGLVSGDFDANGSEDLAACFSEGTNHKVGVFYQSHHGVFGAAVCFNVGAVHPADIVARDFDLDTRLDLAFVSTELSRVTALRRLEGGLFGMQGMFDLQGPGSSHLSGGDFDLDGLPDLVATNDGASSVSFLFNSRTNPTNYCYGAPNSTGVGARIGSSGGVSLSMGKLVIWVDHAPPTMPGMFFYGRTPTVTPFEHGYLCVAPPILRLRPVVFTSRDGTAQFVPDLRNPPLGSGPTALTAGSVWNFQFWYRDIAAGGRNHTNLSDGLRILFEP
jgi:hypothetical protein